MDKEEKYKKEKLEKSNVKTIQKNSSTETVVQAYILY